MGTTMIYIHDSILLTPSERISLGAVLIEGRRITVAGPQAQVSRPAGVRAIDAEGLYLAPGFLDLQVNGAFGEDFTHKPDSMWQVGSRLGQYGVSAFLPTIITAPQGTILRAQEALLNGRPPGYRGAEPLALHLEGPFLSPEKRGAHDPDLMRLPDLNLVEDWSPDNGIRLATLAPELEGAPELISRLVDQGVRVSAGHSNASYEQAMSGFQAGMRWATHLFNAMPALHHRRPGLVGAVLSQPGWPCGLIVDGVHVHPAVVDLVWRIKGPGGLTLVSDAMAALGMPPGEYTLGGYTVTVSQTEARLEDGTLAGSILSPDQALRNLIAMTGAPLEAALQSLTTTPAGILSLPDRTGRIASGKIADLTLLDSDLEVVMTMAAGEIIYSKESL
jgi:N-acetylglucosamine-6-phosphate deacetylase